MRHSDRPDLGRGGLLEQLDRYPFTLGVMLANALLFGFCAWKSRSLEIDPHVLHGLGANDVRLVTHEPWRLLTAAFLHLNVLHLLLNMWALHTIGRVLEVHFGSARIFVLYLLCALGGSLGSAGWQFAQGQPAASAGASGGIFGLIFLGWVYARSAPDRLGTLAERLRGWIVTLALFSGFLLATRPGLVDHAGHLGGALTGALLGTFVRPRPGGDVHPLWTVLAHGLALGSLAAFAAVVWTLRAGGRLPG